MGRGTLEEDWDRSGDARGVPRRVEGPMGRFGTSRETISKVRNGSGDSPEGSGRVIRDRLWDPRKEPDGSRDPRVGSRQVGGPSWRFGTGRETLVEVRDGSREPREGP